MLLVRKEESLWCVVELEGEVGGASAGGEDPWQLLLDLLAGHRGQLPGTLAAVHVNHQIQQQSGDWEVHCRSVCEELDIPFHLLRVQGKARCGESPEAAARTARYRALADWLPEDAWVIDSIYARDYNAIMVVQLISTVLVLVGILLTDLSYALVDPRIRFE